MVRPLRELITILPALLSITCFASEAANYSGVKRIGIFGSYARGEQSFGSDIDILYDYNYANSDDNGIDNTLDFLDVLEANLISFLGVRKVDFISYGAIANVYQPDKYDIEFRNNVLNDVVWLYEQNPTV